MQASVCREHLDKLIAAETEVLARLEGLLDQEHEVIRNNDIDGLERTGDARQNCIVELAPPSRTMVRSKRNVSGRLVSTVPT